jgi:hypothetical protein
MNSRLAAPNVGYLLTQIAITITEWLDGAPA